MRVEDAIKDYFSGREAAAGAIEFEDVMPPARWPIAVAAGIAFLAAGILTVNLLVPPASSPLADELLATTTWQAPSDTLLFYDGRQIYHEVPSLTQFVDTTNGVEQ